MVKNGVPVNVAQKLVEHRKRSTEIMFHANNFDGAPSVARLLNMPFLGIHTPADLLGERAVEAKVAEVMAEKENWISHQYFYQCIKRFEQEKPKLSMLYKNQVLENQLADREKQLIQVFERRQIPTVELSFFMQYQWPLFM